MPDPIATLESADIVTGEAVPAYGLRRHALGPMEVLAQSVSVIAPSTSPPLNVPLIFLLAGNGTWLAYALAMAAMMLIAFCIAGFARDSASPGSLYVYTRQTLPPVFAAVEAWALLFAYLVSGTATGAGFAYFTQQFLLDIGARETHIPVALLGAICVGAGGWIACRNIKISAETMLWVEVISVLLIAVVIGILLWKQGFHLDWPQWKLEGVTAVKVRQGVMLALFSFVGFESATTLGSEAKDPLKTIPRAVVRSAAVAGVFFIVCAYGMVAAFRGVTPPLGEHAQPMTFLAIRAGIGLVGPAITLGMMVSMFACVLGCIIAAARVLLLMAHHGLVHKSFALTHSEQQTPAVASILTAVLAFIPIAALAIGGASAEDIFAWTGTLAVFGFMTAYGLVAAALPVHLHRKGQLSMGGVVLGGLATLAALAAIVGTIYPVPDKPYLYLPYVYLGYMVLGMSWWWAVERRKTVGSG